MVSGLVYQVQTMATGRFTRNSTATRAAPIICKGPGIKAQNRPAATPPATERRFKRHRPGCWSAEPKKATYRLRRIDSELGKRCLKRWRAIDEECEVDRF